jgi:formate/nitrite transporter
VDMTQSDITDACVSIGEARTQTGVLKTLMLSFAAGAFIAFGGLLMAVVVSGLPSMGTLSKLIGGLLFPVGLVLVVVTGADLFTGDCLYATVSSRWAAGRLGMISISRVMSLSYLGNLIGALFVAYLAIASGILTPEAQNWLRAAAVAKVHLSFVQAFTRGIGCNILVCLALWLALSADSLTGKILGIWICVAAFVAMGMEHSIANMFFVPLGILCGAHVSWSQFCLANELPVTLGNIAGGALVGLLMLLQK